LKVDELLFTFGVLIILDMKKMIAFFLLFTFTFFNSFAQKEVKIGSQVWMTENLNV
jgi:hypothetical protein